MEDFKQYYDAECYLFQTIHDRFYTQGWLSAFDLFNIIIWKANRAKSKVANRLLSKGHRNLDDAAYALTQGIANAATPEEQLHLVTETWGFGMPIATAILTVFYPEQFTVYDVNVCQQLRDILGEDFAYVGMTYSFEKRWSGYQLYKQAVERAVPGDLSMRDKDRFLFGKAFAEKLRQDIQNDFGVSH